MPNDAPEVKPKDFEDALSRLESIVQDLERGDLPLESSLKRYEEGVRLARFCAGKLEEAEKRIEVLQITEAGEPKRDRAGELRKTEIELSE